MRIAALALVLAWLAAGPAAGQMISLPGGSPPTPESTPPPTPEQSAADLKALIDTLENEEARNQLLAKLRALSTTAEPAEPPAEQDYIGDVLDRLNTEAEQRFEVISVAVGGLVNSIGEVPVLMSWLWSQLTEPISRSMWYTIGSQIGAAVLGGFIASVGVRLLLRGWRDRRGDLPPEAKRKARLKASLVHLIVNLAALATFLLVTYFVLGYTAVSILGQRVAGDILTAIACVRGATALSKAYLAPENAHRRLAAMNDAAAIEAERWVASLLGLAFYGYFGLEAARRLGLPWTVHSFLLHTLFLVVAGVAIWAIYRLRAYLGAAIERWGAGLGPGLARYLPWRAFSVVGHHVLAGWVALVYLVWALGSAEGAQFLTRGLLVTVLVLIAARAINVWLDWTLVGDAAEEKTGSEETQAEPEPLPARQVALITAARIGVLVVAIMAIAQAWGADVLGWIEGDVGRATLATVLRIALIVAVVFAVAQLIQRGATRYIGATDGNGNLLYSNRTRTLASMARNLAVTMLVAIGIVEVLSELGVNANALLAGAGVVGLAIGFGAQTLVKDLITGLFILVGDTVRVGDVVDLGGKAGVVEAISMRTITLRAYNGDVHTIPYSSIDVVTNMTKDFSFYVFDLIVAYREDVDRVVEVLREIDSQLRREWPYRRLMLEPLEIAGVDAFRDSGVLVKARTKVRAGEQWKVGREFNRRIKRRFDQLGIELPVPQQKVTFHANAEDAAALLPEPVRRAVGET
jgi:small conductance mechanosensitive channel